MKMVGLPIKSFEMYVSLFLSKGYKVTVVEETETAYSLKRRKNDGASIGSDKNVMKREVKRVLTPATVVDPSLLPDSQSTFLLSIKADSRNSRIGVCFVDASVGEFNIGEFEDDNERTRLETVLVQIKPKEILYEKSGLSSETKKAMRRAAMSVKIDFDLSPTLLAHNKSDESMLWRVVGQSPGSEFWTSDFTIQCLSSPENGYFSSLDKFPKVLKSNLNKSLAVSALGSCISYLRLSKIDRDIVSLGNFKLFETFACHPRSVRPQEDTHLEQVSLDGDGEKNIQPTSCRPDDNFLILDANALYNLQVFESPCGDSAQRGKKISDTLKSLVDHCVTPFGSRMLKRWLCRPLRNVDDINNRLDAVQVIISSPHIFDEIREIIRKCPDLERTITRIHTAGAKVSELHGAIDTFQSISRVRSVVLENDGGLECLIFNKIITDMPAVIPLISTLAS
eukprot:TRINITY_DN2536_c0_g2_i1.p1 TRINITY_DN2536_c0_g2~~TRINITY_DN2536_c0_g2_i1.p1  ORF type:complete len:452 (+),score=74.18 TRINITY_DN2536_c0_g2_i1:107-1462(+)